MRVNEEVHRKFLEDLVSNREEALKTFAAQCKEGNPGEAVPEVDPEDLKTCWEIYQEVQSMNPGKHVGVGAMVIKLAVKPGADIAALG